MNYFSSCIIIITIFSGCASFKNESAHYIYIKELIAGDHFNAANIEISKFENKYPASPKLCELYPTRLAVFKRYGSMDQAREYEKKYKKKCEKQY